MASSVAYVALSLFFSMFPFDPPEKNFWFSDVFTGIKREHWKEKGSGNFIQKYRLAILI